MIDKAKKKYQRPELKVVDLSFNETMLGLCQTPSISFPTTQDPPQDCAVTGCYTIP